MKLQDLITWRKDEKKKDFTAMQRDGKYLLECPVCGRVGLYSHTSKRESWFHVQERDYGLVCVTDHCELWSDGRESKYRSRPKKSFPGQTTP